VKKWNSLFWPTLYDLLKISFLEPPCNVGSNRQRQWVFYSTSFVHNDSHVMSVSFPVLWEEWMMLHPTVYTYNTELSRPQVRVVMIIWRSRRSSTTIRHDKLYLRAPKSWRVASLICRTEPKTTSSSAMAERPRDARVTSIRKIAKWRFRATLWGT